MFAAIVRGFGLGVILMHTEEHQKTGAYTAAYLPVDLDGGGSYAGDYSSHI